MIIDVLERFVATVDDDFLIFYSLRLIERRT
jgi:hypothetical protein